MKFPPKCRTKKLGMIYTIFGSVCSFLNWKGADIRPRIRPRKIPAVMIVILEMKEQCSPLYNIMFGVHYQVLL